MSKLIAVLVLFPSLTLSCSQEPSSASRTSTSVNDAQAEEAYRVIGRAEGYIPFDYRWDGCGARAYYSAAELLAVGIPSSVTFVFPDAAPDAPQLELDDGIKWKFHVAAMLKPASATQEIMLDPAMGVGTHLERDTWIQKMTAFHPDAPLRFATLPASFDETTVKSDLPAYIGRHDVVSSIEEMPAFSLTALLDACETLHTNLGYDPNAGGPGMPRDSVEVGERRKLLFERTQVLIGSLSDRGKLARDLPDGGQPGCKSRRFAVPSPNVSQKVYAREAGGWSRFSDEQELFEAKAKVATSSHSRRQRIAWVGWKG